MSREGPNRQAARTFMKMNTSRPAHNWKSMLEVQPRKLATQSALTGWLEEGSHWLGHGGYRTHWKPLRRFLAAWRVPDIQVTPGETA